jgi:diguanylate cyclase (GGDEF)-like protein
VTARSLAAPTTRRVKPRSLVLFFTTSICLALLMLGGTVVAHEEHVRSQARFRDALACSADVQRAEQATTAFWHERQAVAAYFLVPSFELIATVHLQQLAFDRALDAIRPASSGAMGDEMTWTGLSSTARHTNDGYAGQFAIASRQLSRDVSLQALEVRADRVLASLDRLHAFHQDNADDSEASALSAGRDATTASLASVVLLLLGLAVFVVYVLRIVRDLRGEVRRGEYAALHDAWLTGLPNRALFQDRLGQEIGRGARDPQPLSLLMFSLDRFKAINDTLGHGMGDLVMQQIGPRVERAMRSSDTLARLDGDVFVALLPRADAATAAEIAERIRVALQEPFLLPVLNPRMTVSIGIVTYPVHGETVEVLMQHADVALNQAKEHRNTAAVYEPTRDPFDPDHLTLASDLTRAVANDEFELHFQPKFDAHTRLPVSVEALVRWRHPIRGLLYPASFIEIAEDSGLIQRLTLLVLRKAVRQAALWQRNGLMRPVAVNLSAVSLLDNDLVRDLEDILAAEGVPASLLELEITETSVMVDPDRALAVLGALSALGTRLAIDDFGTGYSSLAYLRHLPVDDIKIDRSFVMHLSENEADAKIVRSTIELAHSLGFAVVAEGIEDEAALELLAGYGCDQVQGFYLCRPQPAAQLEQALERLSAEASVLS